MIPTTYIVASEKTNPIFGKAFARGCGGRTEYGDSLKWAGPVAMFGSPRRWALLQHAIRLGRDWTYGDHAYMGRGKFYRITRNAYQHDGLGDATPERFQALNRPVQPWRTSGSHVLLCPNSPTYFRLFGLDVNEWVRSTTATLQSVTDREIRVRWKGQDVPIEHDLRDCWAVVVFSSAAAIDGLIAGVPCFTLADFAATKRMGLSDAAQLERPVYPDDREPFLWNLAANQWTIDEIREGVAWCALSEQGAMDRAS